MVTRIGTEWPQGKQISFLYLKASKEEQRTFEELVNKWLKYANLTAVFFTEENLPDSFIADVKVGFGKSFCNWRNYSAVGNNHMSFNNHEVSFCISNFQTSTILHELGHTFGLSHEHLHPEAQGDLNENAIEICASDPTMGLDRCKSNYILNPKLHVPHFYDRDSIMHYDFKKEMYRDEEKFEPGSLPFLSIGDRMAMEELYPIGTKKETIESDYLADRTNNLSIGNCLVVNIDEIEDNEYFLQTCEADRRYKVTAINKDNNKKNNWAKYSFSCDKSIEAAIKRMNEESVCKK